jgi:hypothetical protein
MYIYIELCVYKYRVVKNQQCNGDPTIPRNDYKPGDAGVDQGSSENGAPPILKDCHHWSRLENSWQFLCKT